MTRAIRFAVVITAGLAASSSGAVLAQNYQPTPGGNAPANSQPSGQPQRASVYGPAVGAQGSVNGRQPGVNAGQVRPAAGQEPIRQPIVNQGPVTPGAGGQSAGGQVGAQNPQLQLGPAPRMQIVQPGIGPQQPDWYPLDPKVQAWIDQVLSYWEQRSNQVKTLECKFQKWEYEPGVIPNIVQQLQVQGQLHKLPFTKYAAGVIKYAAPDKGLFRVEQMQLINVENPAQPKYDLQPKENGEHWICDGKRIFAFDSGTKPKQVIESQLPPEMQGKALADGPLPFMFGARAETIKARYWIRPLQAEAKGEYCLEAVPKSRQDAANFKSVQIVLDEALYLPIRMQIFEGDWSPANPHRTAYKFEKHDVNATKITALADPLKLWHRDFYEVKIPSGWRHVIRDSSGNVVAPGGTTAANPPAGPQPNAQR